MAYDYVIKGATIVDGTGGAPYAGDIAVQNGRIAAVGQVNGAEATTTYDADGMVVAPGFIDNHTHYDAQLFWDPMMTPSNVHGVTTVLGGNCGFTLAPLKPEDADYVRRMMQKVEGMPLEALEQGVPWGWESFGDYLDAVEQSGLSLNAGFLVGHCAIRRYVMGAEATDREATDDEVKQIVALLHESIEAGGLGFSTTLSNTHSDGDGKPVASRKAGKDELLALCTAVGEHEGTFLEGIVPGCLDKFDDDEIELLAQMSAAAKRSINWNLLTIDSREPDRIPRQLEASARARELGGRVIALTMPVLVPMNMSLRNFCGLWLIPGWGEVLNRPVPERIEKLRDPEVRAHLIERANSKEAGVFRRLGNFGRYVIGDTYSKENEGLKGRIGQGHRGRARAGAVRRTRRRLHQRRAQDDPVADADRQRPGHLGATAAGVGRGRHHARRLGRRRASRPHGRRAVPDAVPRRHDPGPQAGVRWSRRCGC